MERRDLCGREMLPPLTMLDEAAYRTIDEQIAAFDL